MTTRAWTGSITALSSIAHGGETRGTITLLRRELIADPDGELIYVPVISGNTLRGRLRRIGEELLRDALQYEGLIPPAAAHALRGGGALAKTGGEPLSGSRLQTLRNLVPQIGVFGAAGGGIIIDGALDVGKVVPQLAETRHITGVHSERSAFAATQLEAYTRQDDSTAHDFTEVLIPAGDLEPAAAVELIFDDIGRPEPTVPASAGQQMLFHIETFPAGTVFSTWLRLRQPSPLEVAFFDDILQTFGRDGRLGGRIGIGHGVVRADLRLTSTGAAEQHRGQTEALIDWRVFVKDRRDAILQALEQLA